MRFDSPVNVKPAGWPIEGGREFVDALFAFSEALGDRYTGGWRDESIFVVSVLRTAAYPPVLNHTIVHVIGNVRGAAGSGPSTAANPSTLVLSGNYGSDASPNPVALHARDPDNSDLGFGRGDTLALSFSLPTNRYRLRRQGLRRLTLLV